jgi:hypothetical protein
LLLHNWPLPSSTKNFFVDIMTVVPVMAAVVAAVVIFAPPEFFGTCNKIAPSDKSKVRVAALKLKIVFAPSRVTVRSAKVSSARDSTPVRTAAPSRT